MTEWQDEARRTSFDTRAAQYDAARPTYPDALVDDVLARTGARRLLEVGAGTGKATVAFARRGVAITAIEPGGQMAAILARNVAGLAVTVEQTRFEDYAGTGFDLVYAAQAFHWVDQAQRYVRAAAAARWLAIVTNEKDPYEPALRGELDAAYARYLGGPGLDPDEVGKTRARWTGEIDASGLYEPVHVGAFPWRATYTTRAYLDLIDTYSDHATLPEPRRTGLYTAIAAAIDRRGGTIEIPYVALAIVARARG